MIKPYERRWAARFAPALLRFIDATSSSAPGLRSEAMEFLDTYQEVVAAILEQIHKNPCEDVSRRYLILELADAPASYVQCAFDEGDLSVVCEAASGYFAEPGSGPSFSDEQNRALADLGFAMDVPDANFVQQLHFDEEPDPDVIACLLLNALHSGYGADRSMKIVAEAPLAWPRGILFTMDEMVDEMIRSRD